MDTYYLAPALVKLRAEINSAFPNRDKETDGWVGDAAHNARESDHNPDWDANGIVRAIDVDADLNGKGVKADTQELVDKIILDSRIACVIFNKRIWTPNKGWQPYTAEGKQGWFNPHIQHFHVSLKHGNQYETNTKSFGLDDEMSAQQYKELSDAIKSLSTQVSDLRHQLMHRDESGNEAYSYSHANMNTLITVMEKLEKVLLGEIEFPGSRDVPGGPFLAFKAIADNMARDGGK